MAYRFYFTVSNESFLRFSKLNYELIICHILQTEIEICYSHYKNKEALPTVQ